jgi:hypothetical protein
MLDPEPLVVVIAVMKHPDTILHDESSMLAQFVYSAHTANQQRG